MTAPVDAGRLALADGMLEKTLQASIVELCGPLRWLVQHSRAAAVTGRDGAVRHRTPLGGDVGFPDLFLVHRDVPVCIAAELKQQHAYPTASQRTWGAALAPVPGVLYVVWRPLQLVTGEIAGLLRDPDRVAALAAGVAA
jgi:hypothetical protein